MITSPSSTSTLNASWVVYGDGVDLDDPTELYHEASTFYPTQLSRQLAGVHLLKDNRELQYTSTRSIKRYPHVEAIELPPSRSLQTPLEDLIARRRTRYDAVAAAMPFDVLATMLRASYGITGRQAIAEGVEQTYRAVPSAGALYPLEVYVVALNVDGLDAGIYHYDPLRDVLEVLRRGDVRTELAHVMPMERLAAKAGCALAITGMLWRSRFKYGQRAYRFTLFEAGHLAQNLLLASEALEVSAVPIGGFYDRRLAALLDVDGLNEVPLYLFPAGVRPS